MKDERGFEKEWGSDEETKKRIRERIRIRFGNQHTSMTVRNQIFKVDMVVIHPDYTQVMFNFVVRSIMHLRLRETVEMLDILT